MPLEWIPAPVKHDERQPYPLPAGGIQTAVFKRLFLNATSVRQRVSMRCCTIALEMTVLHSFMRTITELTPGAMISWNARFPAVSDFIYFTLHSITMFVKYSERALHQIAAILRSGQGHRRALVLLTEYTPCAEHTGIQHSPAGISPSTVSYNTSNGTRVRNNDLDG